MLTKIIEATNIEHGGINYGKFMVCRFDAQEWSYQSVIDPGRLLLNARGWSHDHIWVLDLQTGEAACFRHGGLASSDLHKHQVWVCPMFEPFLAWLYKQDVTDLSTLPSVVNLNDPGEWHGYRRAGPPDRISLLDERGNVRSIDDLERTLIGFAIDRCRSNMTKVAAALKIGRSTLYRKMKAYGMDHDATTT